jgi:L-arabinose isomerase
MPTQSSGEDVQVWFLTGSQALYGEETLRQVAEQSQQIVETPNSRSPWSGGRC